MANDKHANVDEVISANKIRLVVRDANSDTNFVDDSDVSDFGTVAASDASDSGTVAASAVSDTDSATGSDVLDTGTAIRSNVSNTGQVTNSIVSDTTSAVGSKFASPTINTEPRSTNSSELPIDPEPLPDANKLLNELPLDEFFRVLDKATPEQLQSIVHTFEKSARTTGGSKVLSKVIQVPPEPRTLMSLIAWWEWRRPLYNLVLMLVGLPSILILSFVLGMPLYVTVMSGLAYLFMANICYTLGTPAELVAKTIYKEKAETYGPVLLTLGTIFSVIVTVVLELVIVGLMFIGTTAPLWW